MSIFSHRSGSFLNMDYITRLHISFGLAMKKKDLHDKKKGVMPNSLDITPMI